MSKVYDCIYTLHFSFDLYKLIKDYIDSVIIAPAISTSRDLITEDKLIFRHENILENNTKLKYIITTY